VTVRAPAGWRVNAALGLGAVTAPAVFYIPLGYLLGPAGADVVSGAVLQHLDVVLWVTLTTLGVFAGLGLDLRTHADRVLLGPASVEGLVTAGSVGIVIAWLLVRWGVAADNAVASVPATLAVCAAASAVVAWQPHGATDRRLARIADLDDVVVVVLSGVILTSTFGSSAASICRALAVSVAVAVLVAAAGWLLFEQADSDAERGVFVLGVLVLLAGTAAYLLLSPLLLGMAAGVFWRWAPGRADEIIHADLKKLQHPLIGLLLIVAGATLEWSRLAVWLLVPFLIFRLAGKLVAGWAAGRVFPWIASADLGARLLPCGLMGIALAVHFNQLAAGPAGPAVVAAVAGGAVVFEVITPFAVADAVHGIE
jgi:hypothetical protein